MVQRPKKDLQSLKPTKTATRKKSTQVDKKQIDEKTKELLVEQEKNMTTESNARAYRNIDPLPVDTGDFVFPEEKSRIELETYLCSCCGAKKGVVEFYTSLSLINKSRRHLNICVSCVDVLWTSYLKRFPNDLNRSLYYFCILIDVPFHKNFLEEVKEIESGVGFIKRYIKKINSFTAVTGAGSFLDGQKLYDGTNSDEILFFDYDKEEIMYEPTRQDVRFWGRIPPADIYFLKDEFDDWRERYEIKDKGMEEVVKQICHKQLRIYRLNEQGSATSNDLKDLQNLMDSANLKPKQNKNASVGENTLGNWIKRFENEQPVPAPDPMFADVDGIWKKIRIWFLGHMSKIFNYENEYSKEYEIEMSKYRVEIKDNLEYETKKAQEPMGKELFTK